jgi:hypothetical protein
MFFCQEYLRVPEQLRLVIGRKSRENWKIAFENGAPFRGRWLGAQALAPAGLEMEDHTEQ